MQVEINNFSKLDELEILKRLFDCAVSAALPSKTLQKFLPNPPKGDRKSVV